MKVLVVYATSSGCTKGIAERIGSTIAEKDGVKVDVKSADDAPDASEYDAVVVGSGVRAGNWHGPAKTWVQCNADMLESLPVAFFTCGMLLAQNPERAGEVRGYTDHLIAETRVRPVDVGLFAGWFEPKEFSLPERMILKMMKIPQGDFRQWTAIEAWSLDTAAKLGLQA